MSSYENDAAMMEAIANAGITRAGGHSKPW